ncbi:TetR/AcrR family transcriptional regulator [Aeromicrobium sp. Root472D3]|uniref:TetR/AcrR family transcriptional regulator n=1 Tax=Aeromicrobium sp. Root472D3 TaxID=1736540 RepID=UPI0006FD6100|nr:TetR/AcrR family transcriptional regulator [Aeromicrobium sp. Root472D3]KQX74218.1 TetR family transcriptional regulator [Aeromicrobium sp. Root472D3]
MTTTRREQILDTAATLFAERGFHGVSVHDIGSACGISGPALYKHFAGKNDVLTQSLIAISERLLEQGRSRSENARNADDALTALIDWHIEFALGHRALIVIQEREWANLGADGRRDVRALQLAYIDIWVDTVQHLRDDLDAAEARAAVQATFGLINSTPHSARISESSMASRLARMARAALLA